MLFAGCMSDKTGPEPAGEPKAVEVPAASIGEVTETRALGPINALSYDEVYMAYGESPEGAYISDPTYTKVLKGLITYGLTVFQPLLFYPDNNGVYNNIYLKGFYPREGVTDFTPGDAVREVAANKIHYRIDGRHDIMISTMVKGSYTNTLQDQYESGGVIGEGAILQYQHLLSRLSFNVQRETAWPATLKVKRIWVTNVSNAAVMDLSKAYNETGVLVFQEPHDKEFLVYENTDGLILGTAASSILGEAMIEPGAEFRVKVELHTGDILTVTEVKGTTPRAHTINIKGDDAAYDGPTLHDITKRGYQYTVTLNFQNLSITAGASMGAWDNVPVGSETGWW